MMTLSAALESLEIKDGDLYQGHIMQPFLFMLGFKAPRLRQLTLHGAGDFFGSSKRFSCLTSLVVSKPVTFRQFWQIGALPQLKYFTVNLTGVSEASFVFPPSLPPPGFPQLQSLTITGRLSIITCIIGPISSNRLHELHIITRTGKDPILNRSAKDSSTGSPLWSPFLAKINQKWGQDIHALSIEQEPSSSISDLPDFSTYHFQLRCLSLRGWTVTDTQLGKLVTKFPDLMELRITGGCPFHKSLTLSGLSTLAKQCPKLALLQTSLDASILDPADDEVLSHGLRKLLLTTWQSVADKAVLARHLDRLFPRVVVEPNPDVADKETWRTVNRFVSMFQDIRRDERIRRGLKSW
ncbi:hypothetical protein LshimejAT787_0700410 [Lyophyllum shimeji]|uniref:Uncharacterized protein n=1 Tax=Lyophyllum shimeji TaxID=47721 RepID=A0A9P3PPR9_LYOSH|nr:hypothetical protein LshimejAT787_0700410 [Lyophyllum shimeji]